MKGETIRPFFVLIRIKQLLDVTERLSAANELLVRA